MIRMTKCRKAKIDQGYYKSSRKLVDGVGLGPFVVALYEGGLAVDFYSLQVMMMMRVSHMI